MNVIFAGTPPFAATALQAILDAGHQVVAVYTQPDRPAGRGQKLTASAVKTLALAHGLPVQQPLHFKAATPEGETARAQLQALCQHHAATVMVVAAYGLILPQAVLDMPTHGCLNIHASLLPRWRGAAPIQRAILGGDDQTGITIMQMARGLDTGDLLHTLVTPIEADDTAITLHDRLAHLGAQAILEVLKDVPQHQAQARAQDDAHSTYAHKLEKSAGRIDWWRPASHIDRQIRALTGWPVAFTALADDPALTLRVWSARLGVQATAQSTNAAPGTVVGIDRQGVQVQCGDGHTLHLTGLQWPGGKALNAVQILQAQKITVGQVLA